MDSNHHTKNFAIAGLILSIIAIIMFAATFSSIKEDHQSILYYHCPQDDSVILEKIEAVNTRISDMYIWFGFFITIIIGGFILNWSNAKNIAKEHAKEQAKEQFKDVFEKYEKDLADISKNSLNVELELRIIMQAKELIALKKIK